jgi:energy-coupling factor transporter ATP-binding protein EcfA2
VREGGKTVVAVTHDLDMAARMDRRIHLVDGMIENGGAALKREGRSTVIDRSLLSGGSLAEVLIEDPHTTTICPPDQCSQGPSQPPIVWAMLPASFRDSAALPSLAPQPVPARKESAP